MLIVARLLWQGEMRVSVDPVFATKGAGHAKGGPGRGRVGEFQMYDGFGAFTEGPFLQFRRSRPELLRSSAP